MSKKICIDPGHGGSDPGAVNGKRRESDDNLRLALLLRDKLKAQGIKVVMTREHDNYIDINSRCRVANNNGCDYYLSIHRNSGAPDACGAECWIHSQSSDRVQNFGDKILKSVVFSTGLRSRGVKKGAPAGKSYRDFGVNRLTSMPSCLVEAGFITNSHDNELFDERIDSCADSLTKSLCEIVGVIYNPPIKSAAHELKPGDIVYVTGCGNGSCNGLGKKSLEYRNKKMRIVKIVKGGIYKYACSQILDKDSSAVTAWFNENQMRREE